jgi:serine/threonine protein kinase
MLTITGCSDIGGVPRVPESYPRLQFARYLMVAGPSRPQSTPGPFVSSSTGWCVLKKLGKYELIELVGHGAMGEVYKARDPLIERLVALKTITGTMVGKAEQLDRFYQEARSAGALQHPNIVTVYELGQQGKTPFIAMEFLEGESLDKIIERHAILPISQKVGILVQVCRALDCAHRHGVVHRDIKPGNVMLTKDGTVKVVDFGIARLVDTLKTQTNLLIGTLGYMSPEQFHGERANERSDIWGVGVLSFELLCYKRPFEGENASSLILNIVDEKKQPPRIREQVLDCPVDLEALIDKMLKKDSSQRFQTMEEVLLEIEPLWRGLQEESVSGLIADSEVLMQAQDFVHARELLRKALQIDRRNDRANLLLERATTEVKQIQLQSQVHSALARGQRLLKEARYREARAEAEAVLKLDSTCVPANDFLAEVNRAADRARQVRESLQLARHRLAEGALTDAAEEVQRVLSLDATNIPAHTLKKQIQDLLTRRAERKRHTDILQRARKCWGDQQLNECIQQLTEALKEFPGDTEIVKLLETARQDKAELQKQQKLAEAKSLLATQRFDEALAILESLSGDQPNDTVVRKLIALVFQEREELLRQQKLEDDAANLHALVNAGKFSEAVSRGEKLMEDFPHEIEFAELVEFARGELAQQEQKRALDEAIENIRRKIQVGRFSDAVAAGEFAQARFQSQPDLEALVEQARERLKEEKNRELLQRRIVEIRRKINGGQLTDAVTLARETLATNGPDTLLTQMLSAAEMELAQKQEKIEEQQRQLAEAQRLVQEGQFQAASQVLLGGIETRALSRKDPRVRKLLNEIQEKEPSVALPGPAPIIEKAMGAAAGSSPARDYVFQQYAPFAGTPSVQDNISPAERASRAISDSAAIGPVVHGDSPAPIREPAVASSPQTQNDECEVKVALTEGDTRRKEPDSAVLGLARLLQARAVPLALSALVLVVVIGAASFLLFQRPTKELGLLNQARQLEQQKRWPEALSAYEELAGGHDALAKESSNQASRLKSLLDREASLFGDAQSAESHGNISEARQFYQQVADLHGDMEQKALDAADRLHTAENVADRSPLVSKPADAAKTKPGGAASSIKIPLHEPESRKCQLLNASDIARQLERADMNRARGNYVDAKREYTAVLDCDSRNERAQTGFRKAKAAEAVPMPPPN